MWARRLLDLPPRRFRTRHGSEWMPLSDGVRLATLLVRPHGVDRAPSVLIRCAEPVLGRSAHAWLARWLAESGYAVAAQECRGRHESEGEFVPFEKEADDGAEAIEWLAAQPWWDGRVALVGLGYGAHAAFAAASRAGRAPAALVAGFGTRDPHAALFQGGAFRLANALHFAAAHSERGQVAARRLDLARGCAFRPVCEADRVTLRRVDWYREWLEHPVRDAFWAARTPAPPSPPPPALLVAAWDDPALPAQLGDYALLRETAAAGGSPAPELVIGPWAAPSRLGMAGRLRRGSGFVGFARETLAFLDRQLGGSGAAPRPLRFFVKGEDRWRSGPQWPPQCAERRLHLRSGGSANSLAGDGRLDEAPPPDDEAPDRFRYDPDDPAPSTGGLAALDPRAVEARADVLCYTTAPLPGDLPLVGSPRVELHAASSAPDTDFTARLLAIAPDTRATALCEGIIRCRWREGGEQPSWLEPERATRVAIALGATAARLPAGHRLRLEISSSSFPRFDRNANQRIDPARVTPEQSRPASQSVFHDAARPSELVLPVLE